MCQQEIKIDRVFDTKSRIVALGENVFHASVTNVYILIITVTS